MALFGPLQLAGRFGWISSLNLTLAEVVSRWEPAPFIHSTIRQDLLSVRICWGVNCFIDLSGDIFSFLSTRSPHFTLYSQSVSSSRELRHFFCFVYNNMRSFCSACNRDIWLISWIPLCKIWRFHTKAPPNCMKCDSALSWPKGNKSPSLMHDCFLWYICGAVGDGAVAFQCSLGGGARCCGPVHRLRLTL